MIFFMSFIYETPPLTPSTLNIRIRVRIKIQRIRNIISLVDGIRVVHMAMVSMYLLLISLKLFIPMMALIGVPLI